MLDRSMPPPLERVKAFVFPRFTGFRLDNGLKVLAVPDSRVPVVLLRLVLDAGAESDPPDRAGLAAFTAAMLDEGTERRSSYELAAMAEHLGGYLSTSAGWASTRVETSLLSRDLDLGIELLADVVMHPTFPEHEVERLKAQTETHLRRRKAQPAAVASDAFIAELYASGPYSTPHLGTVESVEAVTRDSVAAFHADRVAPNGATLIVCGAFSEGPVERSLEQAVGAWQGGAARPATLDAPRLTGERRIVLVDRPDAPQSEIIVGHSGLPRSHPDSLAASVMNALLGGKFTSRINLNLRERHGYTYGAHSYFTKRRGPGPFMVTAAVDNEAVAPAISEILFELDRLRHDRVSEGELEETIDYLVGSYPYSYETLAGIVNKMHHLAVHDLPPDYYSRLPETLATVDVDQIRRCAREHLHPESAVIAVVGPAQRLEPALERIGRVKRQ